jgi:hypothetical protein
MTIARISQLDRKTTQSGKANAGLWLLEFERQEPQRPDPLTGWNGSGDTRTQVRLTFRTRDEAIAYAERRARLSPRSGHTHHAQDTGLRRQLPLASACDPSVLEASCARRARGKAALRTDCACRRHASRSNQACTHRPSADRARSRSMPGAHRTASPAGAGELRFSGAPCDQARLSRHRRSSRLCRGARGGS